MDFRYLKAFLAAAEQGSFSKAAEEKNAEPPPPGGPTLLDSFSKPKEGGVKLTFLPRDDDKTKAGR